MDAYKSGAEKLDKMIALQNRRDQLAKMLAAERAQFQVCFQSLSNYIEMNNFISRLQMQIHYYVTLFTIQYQIDKFVANSRFGKTFYNYASIWTIFYYLANLLFIVYYYSSLNK